MSVKYLLLVPALILVLAACTPQEQPASQTETTQETVETDTVMEANVPTDEASDEADAMMTETYTLEEVALHDNESDCWLAIDGLVYEVTDFIDEHPGGEKILLGCGKDASDLFASQPKHESDRAKAALEANKIGTLAQ